MPAQALAEVHKYAEQSETVRSRNLSSQELRKYIDEGFAEITKKTEAEHVEQRFRQLNHWRKLLERRKPGFPNQISP
jgi:hypothetical protein